MNHKHYRAVCFASLVLATTAIMKACSDDNLTVEILQNIDISELEFALVSKSKVEWSKRPELRTALKAGAKSLVSEAGTWTLVDKAFGSSLNRHLQRVLTKMARTCSIAERTMNIEQHRELGMGKCKVERA